MTRQIRIRKGGMKVQGCTRAAAGLCILARCRRELVAPSTRSIGGGGRPDATLIVWFYEYLSARATSQYLGSKSYTLVQACSTSASSLLSASECLNSSLRNSRCATASDGAVGSGAGIQKPYILPYTVGALDPLGEAHPDTRNRRKLNAGQGSKPQTPKMKPRTRL